MLAREHISTQDTLAREYVSTQDTLAREHVFSRKGTQFRRLKNDALNDTSKITKDRLVTFYKHN